MAKVAVITDTHFGTRNDSPVFYKYFEKSLDFFFQTLIDQKVKHVIHGGDLFDRRKYLNFVTAKFTREHFLARLHSMGIETHIICGNHDLYYKDSCLVNSLTEMVDGRYENFHLYNFAEDVTIGGMPFLLIPWITKDNADHTYQIIKESKSDVVIGHLELNGFEMFKGMIADHGDDKSLYSKFTQVFSGHYHHKSSTDNIHYLGAFMEHYWSDYNDPRGFHIYDTETRQIEFFKNPHVIFKMLAYDDVKHENIAHLIANTDYSKYANCYVKVICVNKTNQYAFDLLMDKLYKAGPIDISIIEDQSNITDTAEEESIDESQDTPTILTKYIEKLQLPVDNKKMTDFMLSIYQEALSVEHVE